MQQNKHYKTGLVIGRFQPFHNGHAYLIKKSLEDIDKIIIGIGSANIKNDDNPYNFEQRKKMVEEFIKQENLENKVIKIFPSEDDPSDDVWLQKTLENTPDVDIIVGNNDWVNGIFKDAGYEIMEVDYFQRFLFEGWRIRELIRNESPWEDRVPEYLITQIKEVKI